MQGPDFSPVAVTPASVAFACVQEGGSGPVVFARPVGTGSVLYAADGALYLCEVASGRVRVVLKRAEQIRQGLVLSGGAVSPALADALAGCSVRETQQCLLLLADATGSLIVAPELASVAACRVLCQSPDRAEVVFLGATRLPEEGGAGVRRDAVVAVWASGVVRVFTAEGEMTFHAGTKVASCSCWERVLAVCPRDVLAAPLLFDLASEDAAAAPVPRLAADLPACVAVALHERRIVGLATAGRRVVQRSFGVLSQLPVAFGGSGGERPEEAMREAVQAVASQSVTHAALRERHSRANARLAELNEAVAVAGAGAALGGAVEVRVQDSGALALVVTLKNGGTADLSAEWHLVAAVGRRRVLGSPLPRGVRAGASASVFLGPLVPDSHAAMGVRVWLMHMGRSATAPNDSAVTRFVAGADLSLLLCERRVSPLELCWERRGLTRTCVAPLPPSRCLLHTSRPAVAASVSAPASAARTSRLVVNGEYAAQGGVVTAALDSAFGSALSVQVRAGPGPGLAEVAVAGAGSAAEAAAVRAALAARLLVGVPAAEPRRPANDWRTVRGPLAALLQRLETCPDAELPAVYADLRRVGAKIL